jgi:putative nucleotidyltransferase with HDIG domain
LGDIGTRDLLFNGGALIIGGLVSGVVSLGTLPLWENVFKVLTPLKLMELTDPNQPLLRRLFAEAPGTYHHSLIVGNLSEAAAASIGANPLLAKAGAYYHDIGKLKRPSYFKENQFGIENPHDSMEPIQSSEVIISHWEDGIKLGRENKLPSEIMDIIDQHHGNTLISYFYHKAAEEGNTLPEGRFRYGGQKPKTKEATVVMLADSVEAAVRSLKDMNESAIEEMVGKIIKGKIEDGQLDQSPITTKDMNMVRKTFISVLKGIYHERIEYPEKS